MGHITDTDRAEVSRGFDHGNFASAYETTDYDIAARNVNGVTGFFRVGMMLGFFSSYELSEVPSKHRESVERYREVSRRVDLGVNVD